MISVLLGILHVHLFITACLCDIKVWSNRITGLINKHAIMFAIFWLIIITGASFVCCKLAKTWVSPG